MTTGRRKGLVLAAVLAVIAVLGALRGLAGPAAPDPGFAVRMVKLSGDPSRSETLAHVRFCSALGYNALWVYGHEAGVWTKERAPRGPILDPAFLRLAQWCRKHGMEVWVSVNPVDETHGKFGFTDPDGERRLVAFLTLLREKAGVRRFVLSFDDQPTELTDLSDVFRYGRSAAPAHLDLTRRVAALMPDDAALWLCAAAYCDDHLADGQGLYSKPFLAGLPSLPPAIGIVWTGPSVVSPTIRVADLTATRLRLGGRQLLLYDNFTTEDFDADDAMALILGAINGREPGIRDVVAAYLTCPEHPLAGSRLSILTSAEFLRDPESYDPDAAVKRAVARLAGRNRETATALETQQLEWGGPIEGRNYWPRDVMNPIAAAGRLYDPAFVESFTWTVDRYPGRMHALASCADKAFRRDLLRIMRRRLVVAEAMPLTIDYLARVRAGSPEAALSLARIDELRRQWKDFPDATRILASFLEAADVPMTERTH